MSVGFIFCDGCGRISEECEMLLQFKSRMGIPVHLCDECVDIAKERLEIEREERRKMEGAK